MAQLVAFTNTSRHGGHTLCRSLSISIASICAKLGGSYNCFRRRTPSACLMQRKSCGCQLASTGLAYGRCFPSHPHICMCVPAGKSGRKAKAQPEPLAEPSASPLAEPSASSPQGQGTEAAAASAGPTSTEIYNEFHPLALSQLSKGGQRVLEYDTFDLALDEFFSKVRCQAQ